MDAEQTQDFDALHSAHPLDLAPDAFWADPLAAMEQEMIAAMRQGARGCIIDAPDIVELPMRPTLPLVGCDIATDLEAAQWRFSAEAVVVATEVFTGATVVGKAFAPPRDLPPPRALPGVIDEQAASGSTFALDLFERPGLPRAPGEWVVTVLARHRASNRVRLSVVDDPTVWRDPEVTRYLAERRRAEGPPAPWPPPAPAGQAMPSYRHQPVSPRPPGGPGIALRAERVVLMAPGARCVLAGALHLLVPPEARVPLAMRTPGGPRAVLPVTLVLTSSDGSAPCTLRLQVPVYDLSDAEDEAVGHFTLDLFDAPGFSRRPRTCFAFAFAGEEMAGPTPFALLDEAATRAP
ncbi:MAG: hypothetical protein U0325_22980 [Polyangiales bacterium]